MRRQEWSNIGAALFELKKYEEAVTAFRRALKIDDKRAPAWCALGMILAVLCERDEGIEANTRARKLGFACGPDGNHGEDTGP